MTECFLLFLFRCLLHGNCDVSIMAYNLHPLTSMTCCNSRELQRVIPQWPEKSSGRPTSLSRVGMNRDVELSVRYVLRFGTPGSV